MALDKLHASANLLCFIGLCLILKSFKEIDHSGGYLKLLQPFRHNNNFCHHPRI